MKCSGCGKTQDETSLFLVERRRVSQATGPWLCLDCVNLDDLPTQRQKVSVLLHRIRETRAKVRADAEKRRGGGGAHGDC